MGTADLAEKASGQRIRGELHCKERRNGCYLEYMDSEQLAGRAYDGHNFFGRCHTVISNLAINANSFALVFYNAKDACGIHCV